MLAPDVDATQAALTSQQNAAEPVTAYCQSVKTLLPAYTSRVQDAQVRTDLAAVEDNARPWSGGLCRRFIQGVPQMFVDFGGAFDDAADALIGAASTLAANPGDAQALSTLEGGLSALLAQLQSAGASADALNADLTRFLNTITADVNTIQQDVARIVADTPGGQTIVDQLGGALQVGYFTATALSPCGVILEIDSNIVVQFQEFASTPDLVSLALAQASLNALVTNGKAAETALAAILDTMAALLGKYQSLIASLQAADQSKLPAILAELDIQTAQTQWQQLAAFAASLLPS